MTDEIFEQMLKAQDYKCAFSACRKPHDLSVKYGPLGVDHDHKTGAVRGLLCHDCNKGLGCLRDSIELLEDALAYLKHHKSTPLGS